MIKRLAIPLIAALLLLFSVLAVTDRFETYYPFVEIEGGVTTPADSSGSVSLTFLFQAQSSMSSCEALTGNITRVALANCPQCRVNQVHCLARLDDDRRQLLSDHAVPFPSSRMANGVVGYRSNDPGVADAACRAAERQALGKDTVKCFAAGSARPHPANKHTDPIRLGFSLLAFLVAAFSAWSICWLIVKYEHLHAHLSHDHMDAGPQKFHAVPTPRIGGIGIVAGLVAAGGVVMLAEQLVFEREFGLLLIAGIPAFLGGLVEDVTKKVGVLERLLLTMLSGAVAAWLLGAMLNRLDIPFIDQALMWLPLAACLTIVAVGGVANAVNIIDGYNGLAAGYAVVALAAIAGVAAWEGDVLILTVALSLAGALLGFLKWNWPGGRIFLGDGGAYLLGFLLAEASILLVVRNTNISPWFPLLLLIHPIFETLFSIYRRKFRRGHTPGRPDALHMHQLIYSRLVRIHVGTRVANEKLRRNGKVAPYFWTIAIVLAIAGTVFRGDTFVLIALSLAYCVFYVVMYVRIATWRSAWGDRCKQERNERVRPH